MKPTNNRPAVCLLTIDVEEWFQVENLKESIHRNEWERLPTSVEKNVDKILGIFADADLQATFFVLGWVAERHPQLIRRISNAGHEIASHGYGHDLTYQLSLKTLRSDIEKSRKILEDITGKKVVGYRAPSFSVSDSLISILREMEFRYDSSYNPFSLNSRYGSIQQPMQPTDYGVFALHGGIYEIPIATLETAGRHFPMGGGAYFRIFPYRIFEQLVHKKIEQSGLFSFYLHPWELEPEQQRVDGLKLNHRLRHYYGLANSEKKLTKMIRFLRQEGCRFCSTAWFLDQYITAPSNTAS